MLGGLVSNNKVNNMCLKNRLDIDRGKNMLAGDTDTQRWARCALRILVRRAQSQEPRPITFSELTNELGLPVKGYARKMADVCRHIIKTLAELESSDDWDGEIPHITSIVTDRNGEWSSNMWEALTGDPNRRPSPEQRQIELNCSFCYENWDAVLAALPY